MKLRQPPATQSLSQRFICLALSVVLALVSGVYETAWSQVDQRFGTVGREGAEFLGMTWYRAPDSPLDEPIAGKRKIWTVGAIPDRIDLGGLGFPQVDTVEIPFGLIWTFLELPDDVANAACLIAPFVGQQLLNDPAIRTTRDAIFQAAPPLFASSIKGEDVGGFEIVDASASGVPSSLNLRFQPCEKEQFFLSAVFDVEWEVEIEIVGPNPTIEFLSEFQVRIPMEPTASAGRERVVLHPLPPGGDDVSVHNELVDLEATGFDFIDEFLESLAKFILAFSSFQDSLENAIRAEVGMLLEDKNIPIEIEEFQSWVSNTYFFGQPLPKQDDLLSLLFDFESQLIRFRILVEGRRGEVWEVGNTPNFYPYFKPTIYADHFTRYYRFIKSLDPSATVLAGGLMLTELMQTPELFTADYFSLNVNDVLVSTMVHGLIFEESTIDWYDAFSAALPTDIDNNLANLQVFPVGATVRQRVWSVAGNCGARWTVGDFNGDGRDDIFRNLTEFGGADVFLSDGKMFNRTDVPDINVINNCAGQPVRPWTGKGNRGLWYVGDFNGDGKDDIFRQLNEFGGAEVLVSLGNRFSDPVLWTGAGNRGIPWYVGDFNGDGKDDIFRQLTAAGGAEVLLSDGNRFADPVPWSSSGNCGVRWTVGDFNGDGKDDISRNLTSAGGADVFLSNGSSFNRAEVPGGEVLRNCADQLVRPWTGVGSRGRTWHVGDFNGDGRHDIFRQLTTAGGAEVLLAVDGDGDGLGDRFSTPAPWNGFGNRGIRWYVGDFNGDGRDDIFRQLTTAGGAEVFIARPLVTGSAFVPAYYRRHIDIDITRSSLNNIIAAFHNRGINEAWVTAFGNLDWLKDETQVATFSKDMVDLFKCQPRVTRWFWHTSLPVPPILGGPSAFTHLAELDGFGDLGSTPVGDEYASSATSSSMLACEVDLNVDGCVDVADVRAVISSIRGLAPFPDGWYDVNRDGDVNIADARFVVTKFKNEGGKSCEIP